ncbi:MAG: putative Ig protein [Planctomycetaceae bacterium]|nr:putative Ig protein [Planctomycetaceae bacterium]
MTKNLVLFGGWSLAFVIVVGILILSGPEPIQSSVIQTSNAIITISQPIGRYQPPASRPEFKPHRNENGQLLVGTGPHFPATVISDNSYGARMWGSTQNVSAIDGSAAEVGSTSLTLSTEYLRATDFRFTLEPDCVIDGIEVTCVRKGNDRANTTDERIRLIKSGTILSGEKSAEAVWASSLKSETFGGPTDLWAATWTPSEINDAQFGVALAAKVPLGGDASIDSVTITVYSHSANPISKPDDSALSIAK